MFDCTTLITTSPVTDHPDTKHIDRAIAQVRKYMPDDPILILCDGYSNPPYLEYKRRLAAKCKIEWQNVRMIEFATPSQQAIMTRMALESINTPYVFFVEHDTYPEGDIPFSKLFECLEQPTVHSIRLFHYHEVHPDHRYLIGDVKCVCGVPLRKTCQYSSRPFIARTAWFKWAIEGFIRPDEFTFIEEVLFYKCREDYWTDWERWGLWIYSPEGDMCRSGHSYARKA